MAIGGLLALPLAVLRVSPRPLLRWPVAGFTWAIRGTPLLVQLFLLYHGLAQFDAVRASAAWPWLSSVWFCAITAFALNTCAYTTELLAGAMRAVPAGEVDAARALGLTPAQVLWHVVLPSAARRALPAYGNEVVTMLHATSLASVVTLLDLTGAARELYARHFLPVEAFASAALCYLALSGALFAAFRVAERRWLAHLRPSGHARPPAAEPPPRC
ncbi:ABC transporter permease subunit [Piscinibacter sakaiensis]|uniref:ABC transporter permease n=1 Tax=Piscinibacter sakaiensis TaxID=1547922 RepID=UPI00372B0BB5